MPVVSLRPPSLVRYSFAEILMSTPIKPPSRSPTAVAPPGDASDDPRVERPNAFREAVEGERGTSEIPETSESWAPSPADSIRQDLAAGRISIDQALERLVQRALAAAAPLPASDRSALEAQVRRSLAEDPTLLALRRDLERASEA